MQSTRTVQQISDEITELAKDIMGMRQGMRDVQYAAFINGTPAEREPIIKALKLTTAQVDALIAAAGATARGIPSSKPGAPNRQPQPWDYDTKTATVEDLTMRRDLLRTRLQVLQYLRSLKNGRTV
jgi:hypothetical protein